MPEDDDKFLLRRPEWYDKFQVTMIDGMAVDRIDSELHQVWLADGQLLNYDKLILATGAVPRTLPQVVSLKTYMWCELRTMPPHGARRCKQPLRPW